MSLLASAALLYMPAEWATHRATWLAWPYLDSDFPGKIDAVRWAYSDFIGKLAQVETVELLCANESLARGAREQLERISVTENVRFHIQPYNRTWLRDSAPTALRGGSKKWLNWKFNAWAKYDNFAADSEISGLISSVSGHGLVTPQRPDNRGQVVLEGGAFDVDGEGTVMVTKECLLSTEQERNPGLKREDYERVFADYLGASRCLWLSAGCEGDDTHGHIDDIARFVAPARVVVASAAPSDAAQYESSQRNISILHAARDAQGRGIEVIEIPYPSALYCDGARLPASYLNFYIANERVFVPTFNDRNDRLAIGILADLFPGREVTGIHCGDWILGFGSLHCSTQQEPA